MFTSADKKTIINAFSTTDLRKMNGKHLIATCILLLEITWTFANIETMSTMKQVINTEQVPYSITNKGQIQKILPSCSQDCINGVCSEPETCTCNSGYVLSEDDDYYCKPHCSVPCTNGKCSSPETCSCDPNYSLDSSNKYRCIPICKTGCVNGICVKKEICRCHEGYEFYNQSGCQQKCEDQSVCECLEGYGLYNQTSCEPICNKECTNGYCYKPEVCKCNDGFHFDSELYLCLPPKFTWNVTSAWKPLIVHKTPMVIWIILGILSGLVVLLFIALIIARKRIQHWREYSHNNFNVQYTRTPHQDENESLDYLNYHL